MTSTTLPARVGAPAVLAEVRAQLRPLLEVIWAARGAGEEADTVVGIEELRSLLDAIELAVVGDLEATHGLQSLGWASSADFVTAVAGAHRGHGPATVRLAQSLDEPVMAPVCDALADGWLSRTKAQVIDRTIDRLPLAQEIRARGVQVMLDEAKRLDASELRKVGRRLLEVVDPEGEDRRAERELEREERAAHLDRHLAITGDQLGGAFIRGRCSAEDAALIRSTLLPLSKPHPITDPLCRAATCRVPGCSHDGRDPRDHGARLLDALVEACHRLQTAELLPESHGATPRINLVMHLDDLRRGSGFGVTDTGEELSPGTVRRLACDSDVVPVVLGTDSEVLDVGRHQRLATVAIWRALVVRDQHCRFPRCTRPPVMCHAHHVVHWLDGGSTSLDNLVLLCGHHHRLVHAGPWTIERPGASDVHFVPPDAVRRSPGPRPDQAPPPHERPG